MNCAKACPKGLNPSEAIAELKLKMVERQIELVRHTRCQAELHGHAAFAGLRSFEVAALRRMTNPNEIA